jgi:NADH dehydrogenase
VRRVVVTGAFGYTGAAVARRLLDRGYEVRTLTHRRPPPGPTAIPSLPLTFDADSLARALEGASALVNTFWIRLPHGGQTFDSAVERSRLLVDAARRAGVRLVHVSVSNARLGRHLGYYRGKAEVEDAVRATPGSFAIVRPTLVVGPADVLSNNIAWFLRRFPVFPLPDGGACRLQPVTLGDAARIIVEALEATGNVEVDAAGPEILSFADYVRLLARACGVRPWLVPLSAPRSLAALRVVEPLLRDVVLTGEELRGLADELLVSRSPPLGRESVRAWVLAHGATLGRAYVNDRERHFGSGRGEPVLDPGRLAGGDIC